MKKRIQKKYIDFGCGFAVEFLNVPMRKVNGQWIPDINYNNLHQIILELLSHKEGRLTGNEVRFIRLYFEMSLVSFADRFNVKHPAIIKWEKKGDHPTQMNWSTEKDIRLFILSKLQRSPDRIVKLYSQLETAKPELDTVPLQVNLKAA